MTALDATRHRRLRRHLQPDPPRPPARGRGGARGARPRARRVRAERATPPHKRGGRRRARAGAPRGSPGWSSRSRGNPRFAVDALELERGGPSYTVDTLRELARAARARAARLHHRQRRVRRARARGASPKTLFALAHFAVMTRPPRGRRLARGLDPAGAARRTSCSRPTARRRGTAAPAPGCAASPIAALDVSSSDVGARLREGRSVRYLLPGARARRGRAERRGTPGEARAVTEAAREQRAARWPRPRSTATPRTWWRSTVGELTSFADAFVIATASSDRQARAVADAVVESAKSGGGAVLGVEGYEEAAGC